MKQAESPGNILIVDDAPNNVHLLSSLLQEQGYKVRGVLNGSMALMGATASPPDLVLLDINMPEMNGYEVCEQLKRNPETAEIPVIFISALDEVFDKVKAFDVGGVDYITKPFHVSELLARVSTHLNLRRLQQRLQVQNEQLKQEVEHRAIAETALRAEQEKSEHLLLNILPQSIVAQLKTTQTPPAERFDHVTVLFADIVGFTSLAAQMAPMELVNLLNQIFSTFDKLAQKHELEKIKTIGDAYMVAGGLPIARADHAQAIADMALDMQAAIAQVRSQNGSIFELRIGIHTGPVIAGVIGINKFSYDLWGDTVNIASRMESQGSSGKIQLTEATYQYLAEHYICEERGILDVKGRGPLITYWLEGRR